ncbi:MAG: ABC transporter permease [Verrucomicrobia bacterium]|nr:ABC transporter permease [Verrucomicrobiota bacterium]
MSWDRIWAVFLRYFYFFAKLDHMADLFFWPTLDIFLWGMTSVWIQHSDTAMPTIAIAILTGLVFWQIIWRSNYEVSVNLLQEFWNRNMVNLFSTPLKLTEWISALMLVGVFKIFITVFFGGLIVYLLYALNIFAIGWTILPFCASLLLSGWFIGFLSASIMVYFGQRVQMLAWMTAYVFAPFSAVFYPLSALPDWAQAIGKGLPMTYIFEGMRGVLNNGVFSWYDFGMSVLLNFLYLIGTMCLFWFSFEKSRAKGLARLE